MTHVITEPALLASAATDVGGIGAAISDANAVATDRITDLVAPAGDEISTTTAALFKACGQEFRAALDQASSACADFTRALAGAAGAYAATEAANAAAQADTTTALVMGGSGVPIPDPTYLSNVVAKYIAPKIAGLPLTVQGLFTPEGLYPAFGPKDLTLDVSVSRGLTILDHAIRQQLAAGTNVSVLGLSQSAVISSLEMATLDPSGLPSSLPISFTLLGDPMNPNGGVLERLAGLTLPSLGITAYGATPSNSFPTDIYTIEYDGYADFPRYPINVLSDVNALAGILFLHSTYPDLTSAQLASAITLPTQGPTQTSYHLIPTQHLPILEPLRALPLVGNPMADLIQPDLKVLVNLGYGDPAYGYSTGPANVPTPLGLLPPVSPSTVLADLITGTQQGITAAVGDLSTGGFTLPPSPSLPDLANVVRELSLSSLAGPGPTGTLPMPGLSVGGVIEGLQGANTTVAGAVANAMSAGYSVALPTADIANAMLTSMPSYDLNLFLSGILQAAQGDPMGFINAVGYPIAADTALLSLGSGWETIVLVNAIVVMLGGQLSP